MEIDVLDDRKIVQVWLTKTEQDDADIRKSLEPLYKEYKDKKYLVAVYLSGDGDLTRATSDLLCYNKKREAELAVQREKQQDMVM